MRAPRSDYGFAGGRTPRSPRSAAIEAGDGPLEAGDAGASFAGAERAGGDEAASQQPVGRFLAPPTVAVSVPPAPRRPSEPSRLVLIAALTAAVCTSLLALLVRHGGRR